MKVVKLEKSVIRTRTDYSQTYRFRLWVALVEDMELLGMGHRAYHSHIFESFRAWQAEKIEFQNAKGRTLIIDALSKDDIYGFLGKREQAPLGPKRKIEVAKFSVLDAFFQKKYPTLASSFEVETPIVELTSIFQSFFAKEVDAPISPREKFEILKSIDGVYIPKTRLSVADLRKAMKSGEPTDRTIPVFLINCKLGQNHCVIHKVEFPFLSKYMRAESSEHEVMARLQPWLDRHAPEETKIYSGIGILSPSDYVSRSPTLACVLRDRVIYRPCLTTLEINRFDHGGIDETIWATNGAYEKSGDDVWRYYFFCRDANNYAKISKNFGYSADFLNDIFEMKNTLGSEV